MRPMRIVLPALALVCLLPLSGQAQTRAWLDRDAIALGESTTLHVHTDQARGAAPDWAPLHAAFAVGAHTSRYQVQDSGGLQRTEVTYRVALTPRRAGTLVVPALRVGQARTAPISLAVSAPPRAPARQAGTVFIDTALQAPQAYVQQSLGYVVRLHSLTPLLSGQLEQPQPEGGRLQRHGDDLHYSRQIGDRRYTVLERRFVLVPERSGPLEIPPARFRGRGAGGFLDGVFGDGSRQLRADGPAGSVAVLPAPVPTPAPWRPLAGLSVQVLEAADAGRVGEAAQVVLQLKADGATAAQVPELRLTAGAQAQVFADPAQVEEGFVQGRPQVTVTRRFSIVPQVPGTLALDAPGLDWWDAGTGRARTASLPALAVQVAPALAAPPSEAGGTDGLDDARWVQVPGVQGEVRLWAVTTVLFALLWLVTLGWALAGRRQAARPLQVHSPDTVAGLSATARRRALRHALDAGDPGELDRALCSLAQPPAADLSALAAQLADPAQVAALQALDRARWGGGDMPAARAALRTAFAAGPVWRTASPVPASVLPPLYPD